MSRQSNCLFSVPQIYYGTALPVLHLCLLLGHKNHATVFSAYLAFVFASVHCFLCCVITTLITAQHIDLTKHSLDIFKVFFVHMHVLEHMNCTHVLENVGKLLSIVWWQAISALVHDPVVGWSVSLAWRKDWILKHWNDIVTENHFKLYIQASTSMALTL